MLLKSVTLTNVRAFSHAEITFQPGMNLIVGINGVGKSTILEGIRIALTAAMPKFSDARPSRKTQFGINDIKNQEKELNVLLRLQVGDIPLNCKIKYSQDKQTTNIEPNSPTILNLLKTSKTPPLAVHFSPRRALASPTRFRDHFKNTTSAFLDALEHRELRFMEFANFLLVYKTFMDDNPPTSEIHRTAKKRFAAINQAIISLMDSCSDISVIRLESTVMAPDVTGKVYTKVYSDPQISIQKAGVTLNIFQLSDGERGMLALVLDLARRLSLANPHLEKPLEAPALVLIDELDLHLHPQWQRTIVQKLTTTFPNCQFIATTHSPQIIGEVPPENIILIAENGEIIHPNQSLGMDTDWILKYLMGTPTRNHETETTLKQIAHQIETEDYDQALDAIDTLREQIGEFPELVRLQTRIDRLQLLGE
jgi:AAA15 family ATPase/GTPase